jgi:hypothetical protein
MTTPLNEMMASGVYVEARDREGNTIAQSVFTDWGARPVPAVGDSVRCLMTAVAGRRRLEVSGHVVSRHFEVQREPDRQTSVWVALVIVVPLPSRPAPAGLRQHAALFSEN